MQCIFEKKNTYKCFIIWLYGKAILKKKKLKTIIKSHVFSKNNQHFSQKSFGKFNTNINNYR